MKSIFRKTLNKKDESTSSKSKKPTRADARNKFVARQKEIKASLAEIKKKVDAKKTEKGRGLVHNAESKALEDKLMKAHNKKFGIGESTVVKRKRSDPKRGGQDNEKDIKNSKPPVISNKKDNNKSDKPFKESAKEKETLERINKEFKEKNKTVGEKTAARMRLYGITPYVAKSNDDKKSDDKKSDDKKSDNNKSDDKSESSGKSLLTLIAENKDKDLIAAAGKTLLAKLKKGKKMKRTIGGFRPMFRKTLEEK